MIVFNMFPAIDAFLKGHSIEGYAKLSIALLSLFIMIGAYYDSYEAVQILQIIIVITIVVFCVWGITNKKGISIYFSRVAGTMFTALSSNMFMVSFVKMVTFTQPAQGSQGETIMIIVGLTGLCFSFTNWAFLSMDWTYDSVIKS